MFSLSLSVCPPYYCIRKCKHVTLPFSLILFLCLLVRNSGLQMWIFVGGDLSTQVSDLSVRLFLTECGEQRQGQPHNWIQNYCRGFVSSFDHDGLSWDHVRPLDEYCKALWLCKVLFQGEETGREGRTLNMIKEGDDQWIYHLRSSNLENASHSLQMSVMTNKLNLKMKIWHLAPPGPALSSQSQYDGWWLKLLFLA